MSTLIEKVVAELEEKNLYPHGNLEAFHKRLNKMAEHDESGFGGWEHQSHPDHHTWNYDDAEGGNYHPPTYVRYDSKGVHVEDNDGNKLSFSHTQHKEALKHIASVTKLHAFKEETELEEGYSLKRTHKSVEKLEPDLDDGGDGPTKMWHAKYDIIHNKSKSKVGEAEMRSSDYWGHGNLSGTFHGKKFTHKVDKDPQTDFNKFVKWPSTKAKGYKVEEVTVELEEGFKVGDLVVPTIGPHKFQQHRVIHVHDDGSVNITPTNAFPNNKYKLGAVRAKPYQLVSHKIKEFRDAAVTGKPRDFKNESVELTDDLKNVPHKFKTHYKQFIKKLKRGYNGWGDGITPKDVVSRNKKYDLDTAKILNTRSKEEVSSHSPADLQRRILSKRLNKKNEEVAVDESRATDAIKAGWAADDAYDSDMQRLKSRVMAFRNLKIGDKVNANGRIGIVKGKGTDTVHVQHPHTNEIKHYNEKDVKKITETFHPTHFLTKEDARRGADIANRVHHAHNAWVDSSAAVTHLSSMHQAGHKYMPREYGEKIKVADRLAHIQKQHEYNTTAYHNARLEDEDFAKKHGVSAIHAWQAHHNRQWKHYNWSGDPMIESNSKLNMVD